MNSAVEFAIREVAVAIENLIDVLEENSSEYDKVTDSMHHALLGLMREIEVFNWEDV